MLFLLFHSHIHPKKQWGGGGDFIWHLNQLSEMSF